MDKIKMSETDLHAHWEESEFEGAYMCSNCHLIVNFGIGEDEQMKDAHHTAQYMVRE